LPGLFEQLGSQLGIEDDGVLLEGFGDFLAVDREVLKSTDFC
jgi:hypothetical protein